ncbi:MAG: hypothetical protein MUE72_09045, partial [Chitinophagaceae bacterium]|nr:hypothetical protein [Chitinophagaceae bacterium]
MRLIANNNGITSELQLSTNGDLNAYSASSTQSTGIILNPASASMLFRGRQGLRVSSNEVNIISDRGLNPNNELGTFRTSSNGIEVVWGQDANPNNKAISLNGANGIVVKDRINNLGFRYLDDYSNNSINNDRFIADVGTVKKVISDQFPSATALTDEVPHYNQATQKYVLKKVKRTHILRFLLNARSTLSQQPMLI